MPRPAGDPRPSRRALLLLAGGALGAAHREREAEAVDVLRPPGALPGGGFLARCIRCGQCVTACPVDALFLEPPAAGVSAGAPTFRPREQPCTMCAGEAALRCIEVCPTGALARIGSIEDIAIGVAELDRDRCLAWNGTVCRACWHACPFPDQAIVLDPRGRAQVVAEACTGCGICEHVCLTEPTSILVRPHRDRTGRAG